MGLYLILHMEIFCNISFVLFLKEEQIQSEKKSKKSGEVSLYCTNIYNQSKRGFDSNIVKL